MVLWILNIFSSNPPKIADITLPFDLATPQTVPFDLVTPRRYS